MKKLMLIVALLISGSVFANVEREIESRNEEINSMKETVSMIIRNLMADNGLGKVLEDHTGISVQSATEAKAKVFIKDHNDTQCNGNISVEIIEDVEDIYGYIQCVMSDGQTLVILDKFKSY
jgi:hypothetical protein